MSLKGNYIKNGIAVPFYDGNYIKDGKAIRIYDGYYIKNGVATKIYQSYDAQVHNVNSAAAGINADGSLFVNQGSSSDHAWAKVQIATITLPSSIVLTTSQICGMLKSIAATIYGHFGTGTSSIDVIFYDTSFTQELAKGTLAGGVTVAGDVSISAVATGNYSQFGLEIDFTNDNGGALDSYSASAPAGCLTIGGINLKEIELT